MTAGVHGQVHGGGGCWLAFTARCMGGVVDGWRSRPGAWGVWMTGVLGRQAGAAHPNSGPLQEHL